MEQYLTIIEDKTAEIVEKKSKFIADIFYIENSQQAEEKIKYIKKKYYDAKHHCIAYRVVENNQLIERSSDDGEPSGTAGAPMLNILQKNNLCNIVVIVTRYFGGILLGTGGLVRAYTKSVTECLKVTDMMDLEEGYKIRLKFNYNDEKQVKYLLKEATILNEKYDLDVEYIALVNNKVFDTLKNYNYEIIEKTYIEKSSN